MKWENIFEKSLLAVAACTPFVLAGCLMEIGASDSSKDKPSSEQGSYLTDAGAPAGLPEYRICTHDEAEKQKMAKDYYCVVTDDTNILRGNCQGNQCQGLPFIVHYMLMDNLGASVGVNVEAFDNDHFAGNPVATARLSGLDATKPGGYKSGKLYLGQGQYYIRAYIANDDQTAVPYSYQGMQVVSDLPVGVAGALSHPASVTVAAPNDTITTDPVEIYLDQLFKKPASQNPSHATLRVLFSLDSGTIVQGGDEVRVRLYADQDFAKTAVAEYTMSSDNLLVEGHLGHAEMIQAAVPVGNYFVEAFVDSNHNGYVDASEASAVYESNHVLQAIGVEDNRTATITLTLAANGPAPANNQQQQNVKPPVPAPTATATPSGK